MDVELKKVVKEWVDAHKQEMLETLSEFVQCPSLLDESTAGPGKPYGQGCRDMLELLWRKAESFGLNCKDVDGYCIEIRNKPESDNEIGIFNHGDVVAVLGDWVFPPFCGKIDGDFVLGRGAHDNKAGCVMTMFLLRMINELGIELKHGIRMVVGFDEETEMRCVQYYAAHRKMPATSLVADCIFPVNYGQLGGLIGTLTAPMGDEVISMDSNEPGAYSVPDKAVCVVRFPYDVVAPLAEGIADVDVEADGENTKITGHGIATHTANPWLGKSAVLAMSNVLVKLPFKDAATKHLIDGIYEFASDYYGAPLGIASEDESGKSTAVLSYLGLKDGVLTIGCVNKACLSKPVEEFNATFEKWCDGYGIKISDSSEREKRTYFDPEDKRVKVLQQVYHDMTGKNDPPYCMGGVTYSKYLPETITYGIIRPFRKLDYIPEGTGDCHSPNEYMDIEIPMEGVQIYAQALVALDPIV